MATLLPEPGYTRLPDVLKIFPISRSLWYAGVKSGVYPRPVKLSAGSVAWRNADLNRLLRDLDNAAEG